MKNSGIVTTKELLPIELCDNIITLFENTLLTNPIFRPVIVDSYGHESGWRVDKSMCLDEVTSSQQNYSSLVNSHLSIALDEYIKLFPTINAYQTALYSVRQKIQKTPISGGFHEWHCENSHVEVLNRVLAWSIYLNDVDEGGETEFLYQSERVKAKKGKIVIFPAGFMHTHRGNPPISNEKYILTGWFNLRMIDDYHR
tara:strand:- start:543 stop:1139 length:597 start_codon:yes stop_codon:yes gene_type:complete